jgi:hypothetical protein
VYAIFRASSFQNPPCPVNQSLPGQDQQQSCESILASLGSRGDPACLWFQITGSPFLVSAACATVFKPLHHPLISFPTAKLSASSRMGKSWMILAASTSRGKPGGGGQKFPNVLPGRTHCETRSTSPSPIQTDRLVPCHLISNKPLSTHSSRGPSPPSATLSRLTWTRRGTCKWRESFCWLQLRLHTVISRLFPTAQAKRAAALQGQAQGESGPIAVGPECCISSALVKAIISTLRTPTIINSFDTDLVRTRTLLLLQTCRLSLAPRAGPERTKDPGNNREEPRGICSRHSVPHRLSCRFVHLASHQVSNSASLVSVSSTSPATKGKKEKISGPSCPSRRNGSPRWR